MKRFLFRTFLLVVSIYACMCIANFCKKQTDGFALSHIFSTLPYDNKYTLSSLPEEEHNLAKDALSQPFTYLDRGGQFYVFVSEDKKYILKFFRMNKRRTPPKWIRYLPIPDGMQPLFSKRMSKLFRNVEEEFISCKFAYEHLKEDTGLLYMQLNPDTSLNQKVTLYDKIKIKHTVKLDRIPFILQKKADLFFTALASSIENKDYTLAKKNIHDLILYLVKRSRLGFYDKDARIINNFGVANQKTLQIDIGRFYIDPSRAQDHILAKDIEKITLKLKKWLLQKDPSLSEYLSSELCHLNEHPEDFYETQR